MQKRNLRRLGLSLIIAPILLPVFIAVAAQGGAAFVAMLVYIALLMVGLLGIYIYEKGRDD